MPERLVRLPVALRAYPAELPSLPAVGEDELLDVIASVAGYVALASLLRR